MINTPATQPKRKAPHREWVSLLLGWLFILFSLGLLAYMFTQMKPRKNLVCNTAGRPVSLTRFGACRPEE